MCLSKLDKVTRKWGVGYKIVSKDSQGVYRSCDYIPKKGFVYGRIGDTIVDPNKKSIELKRIANRYPAGFHICLSKKHALKIPLTGYVIIKVRFYKVVGQDNSDKLYGPMVVAKKIKILEEV